MVILFVISFYLPQEKDTRFNELSKRVTNCFDENREQMDCKECIKKGELFEHSFGASCEIKAKDANKKCIYNDECDKNECIYQSINSSQGYCDDYIGDNEGKRCYRKMGEKVSCFMDVS